MRAWQVTEQGPAASGPLRAADVPDPVPAAHEIRVAIEACGVCRTDLHISEGDLALHRRPVVPGHEAVGVVDQVGEATSRFSIGDRVGIAWLRHTCGRCRFCLGQRENLCLTPAFTGWDADGGFAPLAVVDEAYAYRIPEGFSAEQAAPLL